MAEEDLAAPHIVLPPCVTESEDILSDFLAWLVGDVSLWDLPLTEMEISEVLWWQEANNNEIEAAEKTADNDRNGNGI